VNSTGDHRRPLLTIGGHHQWGQNAGVVQSRVREVFPPKGYDLKKGFPLQSYPLMIQTAKPLALQASIVKGKVKDLLYYEMLSVLFNCHIVHISPNTAFCCAVFISATCCRGLFITSIYCRVCSLVCTSCWYWGRLGLARKDKLVLRLLQMSSHSDLGSLFCPTRPQRIISCSHQKYAMLCDLLRTNRVEFQNISELPLWCTM